MSVPLAITLFPLAAAAVALVSMGLAWLFCWPATRLDHAVGHTGEPQPEPGRHLRVVRADQTAEDSQEDSRHA